MVSEEDQIKYDPRFLLFEFMTNIMLRDPQARALQAQPCMCVLVDIDTMRSRASRPRQTVIGRATGPFWSSVVVLVGKKALVVPVVWEADATLGK